MLFLFQRLYFAYFQQGFRCALVKVDCADLWVVSPRPDAVVRGLFRSSAV